MAKKPVATAAKKPRAAAKPQPAVKLSAAGQKVAGLDAGQLATQATSWDNARQALSDAGKAAADAQAKFDALPADAAYLDRADAQTALNVAKQKIVDAQLVIDDLIAADNSETAGPAGLNKAPDTAAPDLQAGQGTISEGKTAPPAEPAVPPADVGGTASAAPGDTAPATAAPEGMRPQGSNSEVELQRALEDDLGAKLFELAAEHGISPEALLEQICGYLAEPKKSTHTLESEDLGGTGNSAGPAAGAALADGDMTTVIAGIDEEIANVIASARATAAAGDRSGALAHLAQERKSARVMLELGRRVDTAMAREEVTLRRSATCWPLQVIRYAGEERPIGQPLQVEPEQLVKFEADGLVSATAPELAAE